MASEFGKRIQAMIDKRKAKRANRTGGGGNRGISSGGGLSSAGASGAKKGLKFGKASGGAGQPATRFTRFVPSRSKSSKSPGGGTRTTSYGVVIPESAVSRGRGPNTGGGTKSFGASGDTSSRSRTFGSSRDTGGGKKAFKQRK